jgi:hypothetical protein
MKPRAASLYSEPGFARARTRALRPRAGVRERTDYFAHAEARAAASMRYNRARAVHQ